MTAALATTNCERQSVGGRSETSLEGRTVGIGCQVGIGAANSCDDSFGELGVSAGRFEIADRSVGVRTRSSTVRKHETPPDLGRALSKRDLGTGTLSGTEPAIGVPGRSIRSLLAVHEALSVIEPHVL